MLYREVKGQEHRNLRASKLQTNILFLEARNVTLRSGISPWWIGKSSSNGILLLFQDGWIMYFLYLRTLGAQVMLLKKHRQYGKRRSVTQTSKSIALHRVVNLYFT